jgi:hypothetical protein
MSGRRARDKDLARRLRDVAAPGEEEAEARARGVIRAAYEQRTPIRPAPRTRRLVTAIAAGALLLAVGLSPAGAKVGELVEDVIDVGEQDARPALRSLPTAGELLVESERGVWIVRADGSKRLLGDYREATWSPHGLYVVATDGEQLVASEPDGDVRWTVTPSGEVRDPRWGGAGFDTRIAYRSDGELRVVDGDGSDDRRLAPEAGPAAPAWHPAPEAKISSPSLAGMHGLAYADRRGAVHFVDVDSGEELWRTEPVGGEIGYLAWTPDGRRLTVLTSRKLAVLSAEGRIRFSTTAAASHGAISPSGDELILVVRRGDRSQVTSVPTTLGQKRSSEPFSVPGRVGAPTWSPDGEWVVLPWRDADQWLFVDPEHPRDLIAVDDISEQFDPGGSGQGEFPTPSGWILPER